MASFPEIIIQRKLQELEMTKACIQALSLWLLHHRKHAAEIVQLWYRQVQREKRSDRLLALFCLADDMIQNSRRKYQTFADNFRDFIHGAMVCAKQYMDPQAIATLRLIVGIWEKRSIYSRDFLNILRNEIAAVPKNGSLSRAGIVTATHVNPLSLVDQIKPGSDIKIIPKGNDDHPKVLQSGSMHACQVPDADTLSRMPVDSPTDSELLQSLRELADASLEDMALREKIASFPPDVADISSIKQLTTKEEFEKFSALVYEADKLLTGHSDRLTCELVDRNQILRKLDACILEHKAKMDRDAAILSEWKKKLEMVTQESLDLSKHVDSLPDQSRLPSSVR
ncbi:unnamed protein product [Soboliphyme baturini]|uniref:CID domain-containing protein n=1 Tax=Soboliphyme baturini TaxID=241478 RepID=A0A183IF39_9BILA|nr:unnamed protein product [Soboliphyme baturini]